MKTWLVYIHKNSDTKEVFYVGIGSSEKRPYKKSNRSERWKNYVIKYGNPIVEIIDRGLSFEQAITQEKNLIAKYGRKKIDPNGILVNISEGGRGSSGVPCSEERKKKLSVALSGKNNPNYGRSHTLEAREKIRLSKIGRQHSIETIKKILQTRKENEKCIGFKMSEEAKNKIRLSRLGQKATEETKIKMRQRISDRGGSNMKGKRHADEAKKKVSEANKGKRTGAHNHKSKKVIDTATGNIYVSCKDACDTLRLNYTYVKSQLNGFHKNLTTLKYL
jgi:hypothetical protein